jgi:phosphoglycolate phosphatase
MPIESLRLLVFDLDGTLIDSRKDLANSVNAMLSHFGRPPQPESVIATYIGDGAGMLVRRALGDPADEDFLQRALTCFLDHYREHKLDNTYVYAGVLDSLDSLRFLPDGSERKMAVLSNKPVGPSKAICDALGLGSYFFRVYGGNSFSTKKPDPAGLNALIREAGVPPEQTLMIGDSDVDVLTARNAGTWVLGCRFGLAPHTLDSAEPDAIVDAPSDWTNLLDLAKIDQ